MSAESRKIGVASSNKMSGRERRYQARRALAIVANISRPAAVASDVSHARKAASVKRLKAIERGALSSLESRSMRLSPHALTSI